MPKTVYVNNGVVAAIRLEGEPLQGQSSFGDPFDVPNDLDIGVGDPYAPPSDEPAVAPAPNKKAK